MRSIGLRVWGAVDRGIHPRDPRMHRLSLRLTVRRRRFGSVIAILVVTASLGLSSPWVPPVAAKPPTAPTCQHNMLGKSKPTESTCAAVGTAPQTATALNGNFTESVALSGFVNPTNVAFASDGRVFVTEKSGVIKVFQNLSDPSPAVFTDLTTNVMNYWDRGLLGFALDPSLTDPTLPLRPWIYVLYAYDHILGDPAAPPRW